MNDIFATLTFMFLIALLIGLVKPSLFSKAIENPTRKKVGFTLGVLVIIFFLGFGLTSDTETSTSATSNEQVTQARAEAEPSATTQPVALSEQDQIKKLVTDQLQVKNNMDKDGLKNVEIIENDNGGWSVSVDFNADDNLTTNLRKVGIEKQMSELYITLFKSGKDIRTATITAYFPLQDQYGNVNDRAVYQSTLEKEEADKVNWNADESSLKLSILPKVWTTTLLHPEFQK